MATEANIPDAANLNKEFEDMGLDPQLYESLEKDFQMVLEDMLGDKSLEKFRTQYEKLHRALKTSYESEKRLVKRCRELHDIMINNAARIKTAIILTKQDSQTINALKKEVERAWKLIDVAKEKEESARNIIQTLRAEIANLNQIVEQGSGLSIGQDNTVHNLMREKEDLKKERDEKLKQIQELQNIELEIRQELAQKESQLTKRDEENLKMSKSIQQLEDEKKRDDRKIKSLSEELKTFQADKESLKGEKEEL